MSTGRLPGPLLSGFPADPIIDGLLPGPCWVNASSIPPGELGMIARNRGPLPPTSSNAAVPSTD